MELVAQPKLLFADEPTSGLDSTTSHEARAHGDGCVQSRMNADYGFVWFTIYDHVVYCALSWLTMANPHDGLLIDCDLLWPTTCRLLTSLLT